MSILAILATVTPAVISFAHPPINWSSLPAQFALTGGPPAEPSTGVAFNFSSGDDMVLQQSPAKSCVSGTIGLGGTGATVTMKAEDGTLVATVAAEITQSNVAGSNWTLWKACLPPQPATMSGAGVTITATCIGCANTTDESIERVVFGDVWYCGGQSNMALPLQHTLSRNISRDKIKNGVYSNIRIHGLSGNMNPNQEWSTLLNALGDLTKDSDNSNFAAFSSTCYYFGESLTEEMMKSNGGVRRGV